MLRLRHILLVVGVAAAALVIACHDPDSYRLLSPSNPNGTPAASILDISVAESAPTAIPADGGSRTRIEARIDPGATTRTITFSTSHGTLFARGRNTSEATPNLTVDADSAGIASVELQSGTQPATATVTASVTIPGSNPARTLTRTTEVTFFVPALSDVITLAISPGSADADGASRVRLQATVSSAVAAVNKTITFTTTDGSFVIDTDSNAKREVVALSGTQAGIDLTAPATSGSVTVTATVTGYTTSGQITFSRARPDAVFVESSATTVSRTSATSTGMATITTQLLRTIGTPSTPAVVTYSAVDAAGAPMTTAFSNVKLADKNQQGQVVSTATFDPDVLTPLGPAVITATCDGRSASVTVQIVN